MGDLWTRLGKQYTVHYHHGVPWCYVSHLAINAIILLFQVEAVKLIAEGKAPRITQPEEGATYECIQKKDNAKVIQTYIFKVIFNQP